MKSITGIIHSVLDDQASFNLLYGFREEKDNNSNMTIDYGGTVIPTL